MLNQLPLPSQLLPIGHMTMPRDADTDSDTGPTTVAFLYTSGMFEKHQA